MDGNFKEKNVGRCGIYFLISILKVDLKPKHFWVADAIGKVDKTLRFEVSKDREKIVDHIFLISKEHKKIIFHL